MAHDVLVVGCGVSGLSCAHELAQAGASVRIVARSQPPQTTSNVAAAFWFPYFAFPRRRVLSWAARSWHRFASLAERPEAGVRMAEAVELLREPPQNRPWWEDAAVDVTAAPADWLPPGFVAGWKFVAPVVDTRRYLPWLIEQNEALGVTIGRGELRTLADATAQASIVVDCAGLGARELAPDADVQPIRGQIVQLKNPGLTRVLLDEADPERICYVVPRGDDVVCGGTTEPGVDDRAARPEDREAILRRCIALEPRLATAKVLADVVGLRPGRSAVRVEAEQRDGALVVHDYGHGGAGVTLSWGCAEDVAALVGRSAT